MKRIVEKSIPNSGVTKEGLLGWVRDILTPVLRETRRIVNAHHGEVVTVTSEYTFGDNDEWVIANTTTPASAINIYLPPVIGCARICKVTRVGAFYVYVYPNPADSATINGGAAYFTITNSYYTAQFQTDGVNWVSISRS